MESNKLPGVKSDAADRPTRVCLLWQHPLVLTEFRRVLENEAFDLCAIRIEPGLSASLQEALPRDASLLVADLDSRSSREELMPVLVSMSLSARTIVVAEEFSDVTAFQLLRFGTKGIVTYAEASEHLPRILREVLAGGFWVPRAVLSRFVEATVTESAPRRPLGRTPTLTPREREVLDELLKNLSNKEIARKLRISGRTAKFHVSNVMVKYGVKRRADLLLLSFSQP
jgi:DNA-binding NarL/FixJ family response regulator